MKTNFEFLTDEQIMLSAPSVFTDKASPDVSSYYTHIPTSRVINDMRLLGWDVVQAAEIKARKRVGYQKHLVRFRNPEILIEGGNHDKVFPEILLTNSHDGKSLFVFQAGLFRLVCTNGLVIADENFANLRIYHIGYNFGELQTLIHGVVEKLPLTVESLNKMRETKLAEEKLLEFARKAVSIRLNKPENEVKIDLKELITPSRTQDRGKNLWVTFNVVQEKLMNGNFDYALKDKAKTRKARMVKNFQQDHKINQQLFKLALEYAS